MGALTPSRRLAFDANVLIDLALGVDAVLTLQEVLSERKSSIHIPPTVVQELSHLMDDADEERANAALTSLRSLRQWQITPFDILPVAPAIAQQFSRTLIEKGFLPAAEFNDGCILAEAALARIPILVTSDTHLLSIEQADLNDAFTSKDIDIVTVISPKRILRSLSH